MRPITRSGAAARLGAVLIFAGPLVSWAAELVTAAAWQHPHYSPFYNWVSHLGLTGPSQVAFGQVGNSPLGAVMDTGWVLYGTLLIVGALLTFDPRQGRRPIAILVLGIVGLAAFPAFMADALTGWAWNIGMFERTVIYPIMIGHVLLGSGLMAGRQTSSHRQPVAVGG